MIKPAGERHVRPYTQRHMRSYADTRPRRGLVIVVVAGLAVAVARALHQGQWMVGGVLTFLGSAAVLCPQADAASSRQVCVELARQDREVAQLDRARVVKVALAERARLVEA